MSRYARLMGKHLKKAGQKYSIAKKKLKRAKEKIKGLVRNSHLFAKTKEAKRKVAKKLLHTIQDIHEEIKKAIQTGFVAPKKIIHLMMTDLYAMVRGKSGKPVEFGLKWGINRLKGGFLQGFLISGGKHCFDIKFCMEAIKVYRQSLGAIPQIYGFDRGGYSSANIKRAEKIGVKHVGITPKYSVPNLIQTMISDKGRSVSDESPRNNKVKWQTLQRLK